MCQLGPGPDTAPTVSPLQTTTSTAAAPPSRSSRLRMTSTTHKGGRASNEGRKIATLTSKASSRNSDPSIALSTTATSLQAEPAIPDYDGRPPTHRIDTQGSVQALVVDNDIVIAGLQDGTLAGWSLQTYEQLFSIRAHDQSILALFVSEDRELLFSSGVDSTVKVWSLRTFLQLAYFTSLHDIGDVFCLAYSVKRKTLFTGSQNGAIQYATLEQGDTEEPLSTLSPDHSKHRFFDSLGPGGAITALPKSVDDGASTTSNSSKHRHFPTLAYRPYAHSSYIYSMLLVKGLFNDDEDREVLVTGGGDGAIKLWTFSNSGQLKLIAEYENDGLSVLSMAFGGLFLYAGMSDGFVLVYNLSSNQLVHTLQAGTEDVTSIQVLAGMPLVGTSLGQIAQFSTQFTEVETWSANRGKILASSLARYTMKDVFLTAGNDGTIAVWDLSDMVNPATPLTPHGNDDMIQSLREFVSYRTVAANTKYASDCHEAVGFLRKLFNLFNAKSIFLLPTGDGINPILLARFDASDSPRKKRTILFYGHYDVVDAEGGKENGDWTSDPFRLHPSNGFLYGRGVTDNKGPILAAMFAVAELAKSRSLSCNVVFLLEGEEEAGSRQLQETVRKHKEKIGIIDYVFLSNSVWLDDHLPCLTYGMRGVVHATVTVSSGKAGQHSGMDGKASQHEPMKDLILLLSELSGTKARFVQIPHFYRNIKNRNTEWEDKQYDYIATTLMQGHSEIKSKSSFVKSLEERWQEPNLTIHQVSVPESKTAVTISGSARASLSIRIVPNQTAAAVANSLTSFLQDVFRQCGSKNQLDVSITSLADPWLADPMSQPFNTLSQAVTDVWHPEEDFELRSFPSLNTLPPQQPTQPALTRPTHRRASSLASHGFFRSDNLPKAPLFIREGGSIPAIAFLEKEFGAKAAMFPMGQASDNAHLDNERMRVENLYKGKAVLKKVFSEL